MSTLKVNKIEATGTADGGIEIDSDGHIQLDGLQLPTTGALSNRNLIINGDMRVAQRRTSQTSVVPGGSSYPTCDRFGIFGIGTNDAVWTNSQSTDAPDGFRYSWKWDCTTADASPHSTARQQIHQIIEANNCSSLNYGGTDPKSVTLTFWVKATKTGKNYVFLYHHAAEFITIDYNIDAANTWEKKTLTFTGANVSAFTNTNSAGLYVSWLLYVGSNYSDGTYQENTWNDWIAANYNMFEGQTNNADSTDNSFLLTGVQLEVGDMATPFEHRSYGDELARCQRYYTHSYNTGVSVGSDTTSSAALGVISSTAYSTIAYASAGTACFPVEMRAAPTITIYSYAGTAGKINADSTEGDGTSFRVSSKSAAFVRSNDNSGVAANVYIACHYAAEAEL